MKQSERISKKEKFMYGLGDLSGNIMLAAFSFYLLYFMVTVGGLKPALASLVFIVAKLWDAVTDVWMGRISDRTHSRWGRRRVYMIFGGVTFGLMFIVLWLCPFKDTTGQAWRFIYYLMAYCLFNTTWTICYVPYNALTANMTQDYDERSSLTTVRIVMANVGLILGAALFGLFAGNGTVFEEMFVAQGKTGYEALKASYLLAGVVFGALAGILMILSGLGVRERNEDANEENPYSLLQTIKQFFKMKEFRYTTAYYLTSMLGFDIIMALFMFYVSDTLGFSSDGVVTMLFIALPLVVAMGTSVVWDKLSAKYEKHKMFAVSVALSSIGLILLLFIPALQGSLYQAPADTAISTLLGTTTAIMLTITVIIVGLGMSGIQILPYASIPDIVELDEYTYGVRREGAYYGVQSFMYKLANGFSLAIVSLLLGLFGYKETPFTDPATGDIVYTYVQSLPARNAVRWMFAILPIVIFAVSIVFAFKANMGRARYQEIVAALESRHAEKAKQAQEKSAS